MSCLNINVMIEVHVTKLDEELKKDKYDKLISYVSTEKRERISRFRRFEDAQRSLIGDILIRYLLCNELKKKNRTLTFGLNEYGKPFLNNYNGIHFNISHSGEWVVCCVDTLPVGIDVEIIKPIDMSIAERFFSKKEFERLKSKNIIERESYFYDLWTLKESYIKAVGKGLSIHLNSFTIRIDKGYITVHSINESENYYFKQYYIDEDYKMAVCTRKNEFPNDTKVIDVNKLYEEILLL